MSEGNWSISDTNNGSVEIKVNGESIGSAQPTDTLPPVVNNILDAVVAYYEEKVRWAEGGSSSARLLQRRKKLVDALKLF